MRRRRVTPPAPALNAVEMATLRHGPGSAEVQAAMAAGGGTALDALKVTVDGVLSAAWGAVRDAELPRWVRERPGSRPWAWWRCEAPAEARAEAPGNWRDEAPAWRASGAEASVLARHGLLSAAERAAVDGAETTNRE